MKLSIVVFSIIAYGITWAFIQVVASPLVTTEVDKQSDFEEDEILFERDIKVPKQVIIETYNFSSIPGGEEFLKELQTKESALSRKKRGAGQNVDLWPNGVVQFRISSTISSSTAKLIRSAMDHWEDHTCLRFSLVSHGGNYIEFINSDQNRCYSDSIGMKGGRQEINLGIYCENKGTIIHEIGHAVGFWHEQSRPDRDNYVTIAFDNIDEKNHRQFIKQAINSLGSTYDYGSIMHYPEDAFISDKCVNDCKTIIITNFAEYSRQGRPQLGQLTGLSTEDVNQTNVLYN